MATAIRGRERRCAGCRVAAAATDPKPMPRYTAVPTAGRVSTRLPDLVLGVTLAHSGRPDEHAPLTNRQNHP